MFEPAYIYNGNARAGCSCKPLASRRRNPDPSTANKLQILLTHMPKWKFATYLFLADTQENFTYMDFDFSKQKDKKLLIKERTQLSIVRYDEITYLECDDKLVYVHHMKYDQAFCYTKSLSELECELNQFGFLRIHNNKVVNMQHVLSLNSKKREIRLSTLEILTA